MTETRPRTLMDTMAVDVPEGELDGMRVSRFSVGLEDGKGPHPIALIRAILDGRGCHPGVYTSLDDEHGVVMSDTTAERRDHLPVLLEARQLAAERVLINGLGLGMVVQGLLAMEHVQHVDVVECDDRVIRLVGHWYTSSGRVVIHHADAYEQAQRWPRGTRWDVAWHDVWRNPSPDDLADMARLMRSYGRRVKWQGSWSQHDMRRMRRQGY